MNENPQATNGERDDVATLLRVAGKRLPVPADRAERVRSAVRAEWQVQVRRRTRVRRAMTVAAVAAGIILGVALTLRWPGTGGVPGGPIVIESLSGAAWIRPLDGVAEERALSAGENVRVGSELATSDAARVALRLASGHSIRLDVATRVRLIDESLLALEQGSVYVDSNADVATVAVEIETPLGVVEEIGTQFEVRLDGESVRLRLREGRAILHADEADHDVRAGTELLIDAGGTVTRREISRHGADWEWVGGVAPLPDLEGLTARAFLDWVARERGWTLAFANEIVARSANEIVLGGAAEQLTLDDTLDAVLPTCRMSYHVDDGVLVVDAIP